MFRPFHLQYIVDPGFEARMRRGEDCCANRRLRLRDWNLLFLTSRAVQSIHSPLLAGLRRGYRKSKSPPLRQAQGRLGTVPIFSGAGIGERPVCPPVYCPRFIPFSLWVGHPSERTSGAKARGSVFSDLTARMNSCPSRARLNATLRLRSGQARNRALPEPRSTRSFPPLGQRSQEYSEQIFGANEHL